MSADLSFGSVPPFYREVYDIVCPNQEHVDQDMFVQILVQSSLPRTTVMQIWEAVDSKQGFLTRNGLYKALALTALAQQGKNINDKLLETFSGQELPKPTLGDLSDLRSASVRLRREKSPNVLGFTYSELLELDTVKVELLPEKKGLILKHVEYEVTSQRYKATTLRRYNDFLAFHELLLMRFPYRSIPRLPPKKMMGANREFIEQRRKSLRRYLNLIARHPQMHDDKLVQFFLSFSGSDVQHKIREAFRGIPDEFMTSNLASRAKDLVPMDTQTQISNSKEHIKMLYNSLSKLKDITERMVLRATGYASDMLQFGRELSAMSNDATPVSSWATGSNQTWSHLKKGFKHLSVEYAALGDKASKEAAEEDETVVEKLSLLLDLIISYKDLCDRHEKGVLQDHQRAVQKMGQYKKKRMSATVQSSEVGQVEQLEQKILEQEGQIANMENRNYYSLHCLQMETQLIHANLDILYDILASMTEVQSVSHGELCKVWEAIGPIVENIRGESSLATNRNSSSSPTNNNKIVI
ncbi:sorting nexin-8-like [Ruditapes philippinarum]|uniref:sorting nexin-8-like n=1 Tax=Ruditapes philippinarum TaxID=129788 RepID=UPI00295A8A22|nr:sorting nexin-8-like [Ruditapes philippinarum]